MEPLKLGVAYHSNRLFSHVRTDLQDIIAHHFNTVIHMFTHNDWKRCPSVMKDIFSLTTELGLDYWVDNWGLMGSPGDPSHFLSYYPTAGRYFSDGTLNAPYVCLNSPEFVAWTKEWIDVVYDAGGRKIFWDEPFLSLSPERFACGCPRCKKLFAERYGREMPVAPDKDCCDFQVWTIVNYFDQVTAYAKAKGMENSVCVMLGGQFGISLDNIGELGKLPTMDNIGSDPYWLNRNHPERTGAWVYKFVYENTRKNLTVCEETGKGHNIWVQCFANPAGYEEDIVYAAEAAYDAGARNIFFWGYKGCEGNEYRAEKPEFTWRATGDAALRLLNKERDRVIAAAKKELQLP